MSVGKYHTTDDFYFSKMYGSGIYENTGELVSFPLNDANDKTQESPLVRNTVTGETFFLKRAHFDREILDGYIHNVQLPVDNKVILWPNDLIDLPEEQQENCKIFVENEYSADVTPFDKRDGSLGMLFPYDGYQKMISAERKWTTVMEKNWKNNEVQKMAVEIVKAMQKINETGYIYADIHLSRFYFSSNNTVYLDFSNLIYPISDSVGEQAEKKCAPAQGEYPIEFAEPAYVKGIQKSMDLDSQNYSLCALLFYLFFDRYAYDGADMAGYVDVTLQNHYVKFRDYHKMSVFIFDPDAERNKIGIFDEEMKTIELWEECPHRLKELFISTLKESNANRIEKVNNPTPEQWLKCFDELGWLS